MILNDVVKIDEHLIRCKRSLRIKREREERQREAFPVLRERTIAISLLGEPGSPLP